MYKGGNLNIIQILPVHKYSKDSMSIIWHSIQCINNNENNNTIMLIIIFIIVIVASLTSFSRCLLMLPLKLLNSIKSYFPTKKLKKDQASALLYCPIQGK